MNTDIRLSTDFFGNVKVKKLKKRLGADGVLALIALWAYCAKMRNRRICKKDENAGQRLLPGVLF